MFHKILVGYDGSHGAKGALQMAATMAKQNHSAITAMWVREPLPKHSDLPGECEQEEEAAQGYLKERREEVQSLAGKYEIPIEWDTRRGHPAKTIVSVANDEGYDLVVVGHSDHSGLWGRLLGDTADRISDHAHCTVLIVKV